MVKGFPNHKTTRDYFCRELICEREKIIKLKKALVYHIIFRIKMTITLTNGTGDTKQQIYYGEKMHLYNLSNLN